MRAVDALDRGEIELLAEGAVWRESARTLFVADLHLGKAAAFRALGAPAPTGASEETLRRLGELVDSKSAARLVVLGDFVHARSSQTPGLSASLAAWRERRAGVECSVVLGNHDRGAKSWLAACGFPSEEAPVAIAGVECRHFPCEDEEGGGLLTLAGHLHPVVRISGRSHDHLRLRCFVVNGRQIILPAFGEFTGGARVRIEEADRVVATTQTSLHAIGGRATPFRGRIPTA